MSLNTSNRLFRVLFILLLSAGGCTDVYSQNHVPGENPLFRNIFTADPATLVHNDTLYVYAGHDEAVEGEMFNINEWVAYSTTDMKHWTAHGPVLKPTAFEWSSGNAWASQVIEKDGRFWYYTTTMHGPPINRDAIGVAVSESPTGPFTDARGAALVVDSMTPTPEDPNDWDDIDPTAFTDDDGTTWISWGNMHLYLAKLKPNMTELDGPIRELYLPNFTEGPWIHKRNDLYYLTYACFAHQGMFEKICYATAPGMNGPWTYRGIITGRTEKSYTIHPAITEYKDQWYFFYHTAQLTLNGQEGAIGRRAVSAEYLFYNDDGTIQPVEKTTVGVSTPPHPTQAYKPPVFNPEGPLTDVKSELSVQQDVETAPEKWQGEPALSILDHPYRQGLSSESFNSGDEGVQRLGQTFRVDSAFTLQQIDLYAGDGYGTIKEKPVTVALYELQGDLNPKDSVYTTGENLLEPSGELKINYKPQARGLLQLHLPEAKRPVLKAGKRYVLELRGTRSSAPLFWYRSDTDRYSKGAAYLDRTLLKDESNTSDFGIALYGANKNKQ